MGRTIAGLAACRRGWRGGADPCRKHARQISQEEQTQQERHKQAHASEPDCHPLRVTPWRHVLVLQHLGGSPPVLLPTTTTTTTTAARLHRRAQRALGPPRACLLTLPHMPVGGWGSQRGSEGQCEARTACVQGCGC
jgi:hypothetical protein